MSKYLAVAAILVVLTLGFWWWRMSDKKVTPSVRPNPVNHVMQTSSHSSSAPTISTKPDTSNQALDKDFQNVQGSLTKLDTDQKVSAQDSSSQDTPGNY